MRGGGQLGVDIIQNCEVTGIDIEERPVTGVQTTRGAIRAKKVGLAWPGNSSQVAALAGMRLPIESHVLAGLRDRRAEAVYRPAWSPFGGHFYISQSDKGGLVFGGDLDFYNSYAQRGNLPMVEHVMEGGMALMPMIGKARVLRPGAGSWTCRWTARRSSTICWPPTGPTPSRGSISMPAGAMAGSRRRPASGFLLCASALMARQAEEGDRSWLVVTRDTLTHEITKVELARDVARSQGRSR
jgi:hypothetical protein